MTCPQCSQDKEVIMYHAQDLFLNSPVCLDCRSHMSDQELGNYIFVLRVKGERDKSISLADAKAYLAAQTPEVVPETPEASATPETVTPEVTPETVAPTE